MKILFSLGLYILISMGGSVVFANTQKRLPTMVELRLAFLAENGGYRNINSLKSVVISGQILQDGQQVNFRLYRKRPNKMRITVELDNLELSTFYDGKRAWREVLVDSEVEVLQEIVGQELTEIAQDSVFDSPFFTVFNKREEYIKVVAVEEVNGEEAVRIDFAPEANLNFKSIWLSLEHFQEIKMLRALSMDEENEPEEKYEEIFYEGFTKMKGVYWAKNMQHFVDGEETKKIIINDISPNQGVFDYYFEASEPTESDEK